MSRTYSASMTGLVSRPAPVDSAPATHFDIIGMSEAAGRESRVIVRSALAQLGGPSIPASVVCVPRDEYGPRDLAIAIAALTHGVIHPDTSALGTTLLLAGLGMSGRLTPVRGIFPMLRGMRLRGMRTLGFTAAIVARENEAEASAAAEREGMTCYVADDLASVVAHFSGERALPVAAFSGDVDGDRDPLHISTADISDPRVRRALEVAAAGSHSLLLVGPVGSGKTMLARRLASILPQLDDATAVEATSLHSAAGILPSRVGMMRLAPFRAPHHSVSEAGVFGGGRPARPGEVSLAHGGVLYLDELPEFRASIVQYLRNVVRAGTVTHGSTSPATFPARPIVVASMNRCPCGGGTYASFRKCSCTVAVERSYQTRTDAMTAWFDMRVEIPADLRLHMSAGGPDDGETERVRARIAAARAYAAERTGLGRVERPASSPAWSRIARTIADLDGSETVKPAHIEEARTFCAVVPS